MHCRRRRSEIFFGKIKQLLENDQKVVDNAKKYYSNPAGYDAARDNDDENKKDEE